MGHAVEYFPLISLIITGIVAGRLPPIQYGLPWIQIKEVREEISNKIVSYHWLIGVPNNGVPLV